MNGSRARTLIALAAITAVGAFLRFYALAQAAPAPYYHFHIDEHFVFAGADLLRDGMQKAALAPKFFMYGPLPMYLLDMVRAVYETVSHPLNLRMPADEVTYTLLGRSISALLGTATIPLVFVIANRVAGRVAGLLAAAFLACTVLHLRDSHFFTVDITLVFFCVATWAVALEIADHARPWTYVAAGIGFGLALACKYTAVFLVPLILVAHACSPRRPLAWRDWQAWSRWALVGAVPIVIGAAVFLALDPMVLFYYAKFRADVAEQITGPLLGGLQPIWNAHFRDIQPQLYWITNLLPWGAGPALATWGAAGIVFLLTRRTRLAITAAMYPLAHLLIAGQTITPFMRYTLPLLPGIAVAAGALSGWALAQSHLRRAAVLATTVVLGVTAAYAVAYVNMYRLPDPRLEATRFLYDTVPARTRIVVEPSQNTPPLGVYFADPSFYRDHIAWDPNAKRDDHFVMLTLDVYRYLYDPKIRDEAKARYIRQRISTVDYIVMDDTFLEFYEHLDGPEHAVVRDYYRSLFAGDLGFQLVRQFGREPHLFGVSIDDENAELSFTLFDHPDVYVFKRVAPLPADALSARSDTRSD